MGICTDIVINSALFLSDVTGVIPNQSTWVSYVRFQALTFIISHLFTTWCSHYRKIYSVVIINIWINHKKKKYANEPLMISHLHVLRPILNSVASYKFTRLSLTANRTPSIYHHTLHLPFGLRFSTSFSFPLGSLPLRFYSKPPLNIFI